MANTSVLRQAAPLPATREELLSRKTMKVASLNDRVDFIHQDLWDDPNYQRYLYACWDSQAVEGSLSADNLMAAMMIRDYARKNSDPLVADEKLAVINHSLNIVLNRYHIGRKERRVTVAGEAVTTNGTE